MTREYCPKIDKKLPRTTSNLTRTLEERQIRERKIDDVMNIVCIFLKSNGCCQPRSAIMLSYIQRELIILVENNSNMCPTDFPY